MNRLLEDSRYLNMNLFKEQKKQAIEADRLESPFNLNHDLFAQLDGHNRPAFRALSG